MSYNVLHVKPGSLTVSVTATHDNPILTIPKLYEDDNFVYEDEMGQICTARVKDGDIIVEFVPKDPKETEFSCNIYHSLKRFCNCNEVEYTPEITLEQAHDIINAGAEERAEKAGLDPYLYKVNVFLVKEV